MQRQPRQDHADQLRAKCQLAAPIGVRADRFFVDAAHLQLEKARGFFSEGARLVEGRGVEVEVGVIAPLMRCMSAS